MNFPFFPQNIPINTVTTISNISKNNKVCNFRSVCTSWTVRNSNFAMISIFFSKNIHINIPKTTNFIILDQCALRLSNFAMLSPFFPKNIPINIPKDIKFCNFVSVCTGQTLRHSNFAMISLFSTKNIPMNIPNFFFLQFWISVHRPDIETFKLRHDFPILSF